MGIVRKTISVTEQQDAWIASKIAAGQYTTDSEAIRDLIRREQERDEQLQALRAALIEGEESGEPKPFDAAAFKRRVSARHGVNTVSRLPLSATSKESGTTPSSNGA